MANIDEIAAGVYRINLVIPDRPVTFSLFLIDDDLPTLVETSFGRALEEVREAVSRVLDPEKIRHIVVPHLEGDECGGLSKFLAVAPRAVSICSPVGSSSIRDFTEREPKVVQDGETLSLGNKTLRFVLTPYVHTWDSLLVFEDTQGTLFSSDLFIQPGLGKAVTDRDLSEQMVELYRRGGLMPSMKHLHRALYKLEPLDIKTIACHHGSVLNGNLHPYFQALWDQDVTGLADSEASAYTKLMQE
ncbi:MAG: FprA family A-type flavoprotein [Dehalococcoidia bacterium]